MAKRNRTQVRRKRHAHRLQKMLDDARLSTTPRLRDVPHCPWGVSWDFARLVAARLCKVDAPMPMNFDEAQQTTFLGRFVSSVVLFEVLPIAVVMSVRGRRVAQIHAEFAESISRIQRGDVA